MNWPAAAAIGYIVGMFVDECLKGQPQWIRIALTFVAMVSATILLTGQGTS